MLLKGQALGELNPFYSDSQLLQFVCIQSPVLAIPDHRGQLQPGVDDVVHSLLDLPAED